MNKKNCMYCGKEFDEDDMTREHVIPQVIGGNIEEKNPFIIYNVCKRCNNVAGTFIDGIFAKQFLTKDNIDRINSRYTDINENPFMPSTYMGKVKGIAFNRRICELWIGPAGDYIFHFHEPYEEKPMIPMIGKPTYINSKDIDYGFVFLYIFSNNPIWQTTTVNSVKKTFNKSVIYFGNGDHSLCEIFSEIPTELRELHNSIKDKMINHEKFNIEFPIPLHVNDRFLFKIALGMSGIFLKDEFILSDEAKLLRDGMWSKTNEEIEDIEIAGTAFFKKTKHEIDKYLNMENCHVITLIKLPEGIFLNISLWGNMNSTVRLTKNVEYLDVDINDFGIVYVIAPGLKKCIGPIELMKFIGFKNKCGGDERLFELEKEISDIPENPPFNI